MVTTRSKPSSNVDLFAGVSIASSEVIINDQKVKETPSEIFRKAVKKQLLLVRYDQKTEEEQKKETKVPDGRRWYRLKDGKAYTFLRYGTKKILLMPGMTEEKSVYQVGTSLEDLAKFYNNIITAVYGGLYADVIDKVAAAMIKERNETKEKNKKAKIKADLEAQRKAEEKKQAEIYDQQEHSTPDSIS